MRISGKGLALVLGITCVARAEPAVLTIVAERALRVGEADTLTIDLELPGDAAKPLLMTVHAEGHALEIVKGRVSRHDARGEGSSMSFAIPVVSRAAGSSIVRAHVRYFRCPDSCRAEEVRTVSTVEVLTR
jgi:hypothetical protein